MKHKIGDTVKITANISSHRYEIGSNVVIEDVGVNDYKGNEVKGLGWWFNDEECELVEASNEPITAERAKTLEDFQDEVSLEKTNGQDKWDKLSGFFPIEFILGILVESKDRFHAYQMAQKDKEISELKDKCTSEYWRGWTEYGNSL